MDSLPDKLTIETPEQSALDFPLAGIGSRFLATLVDSAIQFVAVLLLWLVALMIAPGLSLLGANADVSDISHCLKSSGTDRHPGSATQICG